ncbi:hypothetical protein L3X38_041503 [Prunus dulcis]|uniref:Uncharacterized protein n=1 Tax=Prunus dulcis TaxID=3755 RepID=A0AAD4UST9_PRUDU|nr:hypothetical protein L3X38_041503 [Prunus dulcis]
MKIQEKYKAEIESMFSDPTIFEIERDLPTTQPTQPVEEKEEDKERRRQRRRKERRRERRSQEEKEEEKKQQEDKEDKEQQQEKEEEKKQQEDKEEDKEQQQEKEEEKKQDTPTPDVPTRIQRLKNRERKRHQASCYEYETDRQPKRRRQKRIMKKYHNLGLSLPRSQLRKH